MQASTTEVDEALNDTYEVLLAVEASILQESHDAVAQARREGLPCWIALEGLHRSAEQYLWVIAQAERDTLDSERSLISFVLGTELRELSMIEEVERHRIDEHCMSIVTVLLDNFMKDALDHTHARHLHLSQRSRRSELISSELDERICHLDSSTIIANEVQSLEREVEESELALALVLQGLEQSATEAHTKRGTYGTLCSTASSLLVSPSATR